MSDGTPFDKRLLVGWVIINLLRYKCSLILNHRSKFFCTFIVDYQLLSINYAESKIQHSPHTQITKKAQSDSIKRCKSSSHHKTRQLVVEIRCLCEWQHKYLQISWCRRTVQSHITQHTQGLSRKRHWLYISQKAQDTSSGSKDYGWSGSAFDSPRLPYTSRGILQVDTQIIVRKNGTNEIYR